MQPIKDYMVEDCGVDHAQYFPGRGVAYTAWDVVFVGAGDTPHAAAEDAIEQYAMSGYDTATIVNDLSEDSDLDDTAEDEDSELYHYAAVYIKV